MNRRWLSAIAGIAVLTVLTASAGIASAQAASVLRPAVVGSVTPVKTIPLRDMANVNLPSVMRRIVGNRHYVNAELTRLRQKLIKSGVLKPAGFHAIIPLYRKHPAMSRAPVVHDPVIQTTMPPAPRIFTVPMANFDGIGAARGDSPSVAPPDTNAAVGLNDVVEITNLGYPDVGSFAVWDKSGNLLQAPTSLSSLWSSGDCIQGEGDSVVKYDQLADRWIMEQFDPGYTGVCVAISATSDPLGAYYVYEFVIDSSGGFTDYPKLSVWPDAYYMTTNDFGPNVVNFVALDRAQMLAGQPAQFVVINGPSGFSPDYSALPADLDGTLYTPPAGDPGIFVNYVSPYLMGTSFYALEMWQMTVDWSTPSNSTLTGPTQITVDPFNDGICGYARSCIPQPSPGTPLDALGDRLMFRLAYRNLANAATPHQALVVSMTVGTGSAPSGTPAGIRWYELTAPAGATSASAWTVAQQSTFMPSDGSSRWMPSIAMDASGNIALGYSLSSSSINPSVVYTGRLATDPAGQMTEPESTLVTGGGVQEGTGSRWGDYSSMAVDPSDDCTFWYAQEYYSTSGSFAWSTRIGAFKFANCTQGPSGTLSGAVTAAASGSAIAGATISVSNGAVTTTDNSGNYTITLATGTYSMTASDYGYLPQTVTGVTVTQNQTTTQNFQLQSAPTWTVSGNVTDGTPGGHTYGLYAEVKVTAVGFGQVADVWTNPTDGSYSVSLFQGYSYTFEVIPWLNGYNDGSATIANLTSDTTQNFPLTITSACTAPGYQATSTFSEDFNGSTFPPSGWTITNDVSGSQTVWATNTYWYDSNYTQQAPSTSTAATADSNNAGAYLGYYGPYDTSLVTPPIAVSTLGASPALRWDESYSALGDNFDVDISTDGGTTWTTIEHYTSGCGALYGTPGCSMGPVSLSSFLPASGTFQLRWRYYDLGAGYTWYAQIDNVSIGACVPVSGGLVLGQTTDANTSNGLVGATVADDTGASTRTFQNPADSNLSMGYYFLFSPTGSRTVTASDSGYTSVNANVSVADNSVNPQNFVLPAGKFTGTPTSFNLHVMVNNQVNKTFTVANIGTGSAYFHMQTINAPPPSTVAPSRGVLLNLVHCTYLSPLSLAAQSGKGGSGNAGCGGPSGPVLPAAPASTWAAIASYPAGVMDNAMARDAGSGKIYSAGGVVNSAATNAFYVYDPSSDMWTQAANMPTALERPAVAVIGGKLYVANGWTSSGGSSSQLLIYDPSSDSWSTGASNPAGLGGGSDAVALGGKLYVIGGCTSSCGKTTVEIYNPAADSWSAGAAYPELISWQACGAVNGKIYCAGGTGGSSDTTDAYVYAPAVNTWTAIAPIPYDNWGMGYMAWGQGLLISQGVTNGFSTVTNQGASYDPGTDTWSPLPNAIDSVYRMGSACGFYTAGGSTGGFSGSASAEVLAGYSPCGYSPIPWLTIAPVTGTVAAGASTNVTLTFDGTGQTEFTTSQAQMILTGNTPYPSQMVPLTVTWDPQPVDLVVSGVSTPSTINKGAEVFYNVTTTNQPQTNHGNATNVNLTLPLPAGASYVAGFGNNCQMSSGTLNCALGDLALGASSSVTVILKAMQAGTLNANFTATAREPQAPAGDNQTTVVTTVIGTADVKVVSFSGSGAINNGSNGTVTLTVGNGGPDTATGVAVAANSVNGILKVMSASSAQGSCSVNAGNVSCNLSDITSGATATVTITVRGKQAGQGVVTALVTTSSNDPDLSNNGGQAGVTVNLTSGGGGGTGLPTLLVLLALALFGAYYRMGIKRGVRGKVDD